MNAEDAINYIENLAWSKTCLGLDRTRQLLAEMGNPQDKLRFIHVAGTNGKGSTCAMLASVMKEAGYKTGLYTSPYICSFNERMQVNGRMISDDKLVELTSRVMHIAEHMPEHPSQFELVTAMAMQYFLDEKCDIVVLEVGLGGALDSTNVIKKPDVAVITNIGLEHTEYLGSTLAKIAFAKAGIIKSDCTAICYRGTAEVERVFEKVCDDNGARLIKADFESLVHESDSLKGQYFSWRSVDNLFLPLLGEHQLKNAAVALEALEVMRDLGWNISEQDIRSGLAKTAWPARFELLNEKPAFFIDGAHNPQCAAALAAAISRYLPGEKVTFLIGVLDDKDYPTMISVVGGFAKKFICITPNSPRAMRAEKLATYLKEEGYCAECADDVDAGIAAALCSAGADPIIAFGSLYMAGMVREKAQMLFQSNMNY